MKSTNGPLSPLHYVLHSRLHLWKINTQSVVNVCENPILHIFYLGSSVRAWRVDWVVCKAVAFLNAFYSSSRSYRKKILKARSDRGANKRSDGTEVNNKSLRSLSFSCGWDWLFPSFTEDRHKNISSAFSFKVWYMNSTEN